jgi:hypothetical protein
LVSALNTIFLKLYYFEMEEKFEKGGEFRMATGGEIVFKPITTPL